MRRGMLSDANMEERTATEITSSAGDFNLTVIEFQGMWEQAVIDAVRLCAHLSGQEMDEEAARDAVALDWGNGVLYDEDKVWEQYRQMVSDGLLRPEIALGWRFNLPTDTQAQLDRIRKNLMPEQTVV